MVGNIWSAQYLPPGVLCAFAGAESPRSAVCGSLLAAPFTHGCRFRCGDRQVCSPLLPFSLLLEVITYMPLHSSEATRNGRMSVCVLELCR